MLSRKTADFRLSFVAQKRRLLKHARCFRGYLIFVLIKRFVLKVSNVMSYLIVLSFLDNTHMIQPSFSFHQESIEATMSLATRSFNIVRSLRVPILRGKL